MFSVIYITNRLQKAYRMLTVIAKLVRPWYVHGTNLVGIKRVLAVLTWAEEHGRMKLLLSKNCNCTEMKG